MADSLLILSALCAWARDSWIWLGLLSLIVVAAVGLHHQWRDALRGWRKAQDGWRDAIAHAQSMERQRDSVLQANKRLSLAAEHWATRYCEMDAMAKEHAADADYWISAAIEAYKQLGSPLPEDRKDSVRDMRVIDSLIRSTGARPQ